MTGNGIADSILEYGIWDYWIIGYGICIPPLRDTPEVYDRECG